MVQEGAAFQQDPTRIKVMDVMAVLQQILLVKSPAFQSGRTGFADDHIIPTHFTPSSIKTPSRSNHANSEIINDCLRTLPLSDGDECNVLMTFLSMAVLGLSEIGWN